MKTSTMCFLSAIMLVIGSLVLSGCGQGSSNSTNIFYRPVGICKGYKSPAGPITAGANKGFAVFKIESVDNTKYGGNFAFAPERLFVNQSPPVLALGTGNRRFVYPDPKFAQAMGFGSIPQTTIPAGEKLDINSVVIIPLDINNPSGGAEANQFSFELAYDTGSGQRGEQDNVNEDIVFTITTPPTRSGRWSRIAKICRSNSGR